MKLAPYLRDETILLHTEVRDKARLFELCEDAVRAVEGAVAARSVVQRLVEREGQSPTYLGHSVAVPHAFVDACSELRLVFCRPADALDYGDGKVARLVFALVAPPAQKGHYVRLLARIARICMEPGVIDQLLTLDSPAAVRSYLSELDGDGGRAAP
jgi:nitrogen PTS system EIIA component